MKILFVCNNAYTKGNGLTTSIQNTIKHLRERNLDVRLMAIANPDPEGPQPDFPLKHFKFPLFEPIIRANGFSYAQIDRRVIRKAVEWADIVHFQEALLLESVVRRIAVKQGKTCTGTFHLYPHNITSNLALGRENWVNPLLMKYWNWTVFNHCSDIQCPTRPVKDYLEKNHTKARLHVISNGIQLPEPPLQVKPVNPEPEVKILCIGRLAKEKSQKTLLEAMRYSRHAGRIRLIFAGKGQLEKRYRKQAEKLYREGILGIMPEFGFYSPEELRNLARECYLYIHCAYVEVEGLSCLESMREGLVPVIGQGELIGTSQFALCPESLYPVSDSRALAQRIDWWIEHPLQRNQMSQRYADQARRYAIDQSIDALTAMFQNALQR